MIQLYPASQSQHSLSTAPVVLGAEATSPTEDDNFGMTSIPGTPVTVPTTPNDVKAPSLEMPLSPLPPPGQSLERPTSSSIVLDPEYYWPSVKFSIQQHLVRLPVGLFIQHSERFATDYGLSSCSSVPGLGREEREIVLDVEWEDFRNFLKALAPRSPFLEDKPALSESEWISVLKLSTKWHFNDLRKVAIDELSGDVKIDAIQRIGLARSYAVCDWLVSAYEELVERDEPISEEEGEKIGMSTALKLSGVALRRLRGTKSVTTCSGLRRKREFPRDDILKAFGDEFDNIQRVQGQYLTKSERREKEAREAAEAKAKREEEERLEVERKAEMEKRAAEEEAMRVREEEEAKRKAREEEDARTAAERAERIQKLRMEEERVKRELEEELNCENSAGPSVDSSRSATTVQENVPNPSISEEQEPSWPTSSVTKPIPRWLEKYLL